MKYKTFFSKLELNFISPVLTSRGKYSQKTSWLIGITKDEKTGIGECSLLNGLSIDDHPGFEEKLSGICNQIATGTFNFNNPLFDFPSIRFGIETAMLDLQNGGTQMLFPSEFSKGIKGIPINGLIWMGNKKDMKKQIAEKIEKGFSCIKLKIGAIGWNTEKEIIAEMRRQFNISELTIRVDANGAFTPKQVPEVLSELAEMQVHSIEQPIKAGQWDKMAKLCKSTPVPIALDEELIGIISSEKKRKLIETVCPQYLVIKPGLLGGFKTSDEWTELANENNIGWWATSALESNIGLNAISQWVYTKNITTHQGLGTGLLYTNNIDSPLTLNGENLFYDVNKKWGYIERR